MGRTNKNGEGQIMLFFVIVFLFFLAVYFIFRDIASWIPLIIPEFLGVTLIAILVSFAFKKSTKMGKFLWVTGFIFVLGLSGFIIGRAYEIRFLVDLMPELLGSTGLGFVLSVIFKRKFML